MAKVSAREWHCVALLCATLACAAVPGAGSAREERVSRQPETWRVAQPA